MEKIKLENIAPYLPYGLKIKVLNHECDYVGIEYSVVNGYYFLGDSLHITYKGGSAGKSVSEFKSILRPLSDLTKEIEHNGEKFVPIIELYKLRTQVTTDKIERYYIEFDTAVLKLKEINIFNKIIKTYFEVDIEPSMVSFSIVTERYEGGHITGENINMCGNELTMYQFLFKHHFDVFGLIDKGLAIDINTLKL